MIRVDGITPDQTFTDQVARLSADISPYAPYISETFEAAMRICARVDCTDPYMMYRSSRYHEAIGANAVRFIELYVLDPSVSAAPGSAKFAALGDALAEEEACYARQSSLVKAAGALAAYEKLIAKPDLDPREQAHAERQAYAELIARTTHSVQITEGGSTLDHRDEGARHTAQVRANEQTFLEEYFAANMALGNHLTPLKRAIREALPLPSEPDATAEAKFYRDGAYKLAYALRAARLYSLGRASRISATEAGSPPPASP